MVARDLCIRFRKSNATSAGHAAIFHLNERFLLGSLARTTCNDSGFERDPAAFRNGRPRGSCLDGLRPHGQGPAPAAPCSRGSFEDPGAWGAAFATTPAGR